MSAASLDQVWLPEPAHRRISGFGVRRGQPGGAILARGAKIFRLAWLSVGVLASVVGCKSGSEASKGGADLESSQLAQGSGYVLHEVPLGLDPVGFAEGWARDLPFAEDIRERGPSAFRAVERGVLLRRLFESASHDELARNPPTELEEIQAEQKHWHLVALPRAVRAVEVRLPVKFFESNEIALDKLVRVRAAAAPALSIEDLVRRVSAAPTEVKASISARKLPPLSADGRVVVKSAEDDPNFVLSASLHSALASLQRAGDVSEIVGSRGGYHFFYAIEIWPEVSLSGSGRKRALEPLVAADRMAPSLAELRKTLRAAAKIERSANTSALLERIGRND